MDLPAYKYRTDYPGPLLDEVDLIGQNVYFHAWRFQLVRRLLALAPWPLSWDSGSGHAMQYC